MGSTQKDKEHPQEPLPEITGYKLVRVLGHGGMSTVYLGQQLSLGRNVAIKIMRPEVVTDDVGRRRFDNEARTVARLDHPHIVRIHDFGRTKDGQPYHVMPVFPRGHLGKRNLTRDEARIRQILEALLSALAYAHSRGVVHRDVKAENVLFDEAERPMLTDFGIALRRGYGSRVTTAGMAVGSTAYMAPEQARGTEVDLRADLYSLGVLAWEMLTGSLPYQADDGLSMVLKHAQDPIPRLPPHLAHWQRFFDRALAKQPNDRYSDAQEMLEAMRNVPHAEREPMRAAIARLRARFGLRQLAVAALVVGVVASGIVALYRMDQRNTQETLARMMNGNASATSTDTPGVDLSRSAPLPDPSEAILRGAPESAAQKYITAAEQQLRSGRLTSPAGGNAYDSLMLAWRTDPSHIALPEASTRLLTALGNDADRRLRNGEDTAVRDIVSRMQRLAEQDRARGLPVMVQLRKRMGDSLSSAMTQAEAQFNRDAAQKIVTSAKSLGLDRAQVAALQTRAGSIAQPGDRVADALGEMTLVAGSGNKLVAISRSTVTRENYAAFAKLTQRKPALCREKASLLRVLAPRTWETPGFEQANSHAVVCVSWQDADAFARWQSQRTGHRYRLPTASEAQAAGYGSGGKQVSEWLGECSGSGCVRRMASGRSWRGAGGGRPLDAGRGYDDVGFRLVREL
ncbi:bifunctional serine/threonine-protein kinase/formylglycine-generating enzyme family protein [Lysobacter brunescens]|uniref:Bifunctional serine/threonine-protein kinase/formylglycine-generating enzyme family protein n=1 Tax=Lysobacter brunescens TaxID=262323 RepID=A0ABW2YEB4_9GAMM